MQKEIVIMTLALTWAGCKSHSANDLADVEIQGIGAAPSRVLYREGDRVILAKCPALTAQAIVVQESYDGVKHLQLDRTKCQDISTKVELDRFKTRLAKAYGLDPALDGRDEQALRNEIQNLKVRTESLKSSSHDPLLGSTAAQSNDEIASLEKLIADKVETLKQKSADLATINKVLDLLNSGNNVVALPSSVFAEKILPAVEW